MGKIYHSGKMIEYGGLSGVRAIYGMTALSGCSGDRLGKVGAL